MTSDYYDFDYYSNAKSSKKSAKSPKRQNRAQRFDTCRFPFPSCGRRNETCQRVRFRRNGEWRLRWDFGPGLCIPDDRCLPFNVVLVGSVGDPGSGQWTLER